MLLQPITVPFSKSTLKPSVYTLIIMTSLMKKASRHLFNTVNDRHFTKLII